MRENIYKISLLPRQEKKLSIQTADQRKVSLRAGESFKEVVDRKQGISAVSVRGGNGSLSTRASRETCCSVGSSGELGPESEQS